MEFKYVTGDLDKIDLTAPIYPLRDHTRGVGLYGIDIAWLLEHYAAWRGFWSGYTPDTYKFTNNITIAQAGHAINRQYDVTNLVKPDAVFADKELPWTTEYESVPYIDTVYPECFYSSTSELPDGSKGWGGYSLTHEWLKSSFNLCRYQKRSLLSIYSDDWNDDAEIEIVEQHGEVEYPQLQGTYYHDYWDLENSFDPIRYSYTTKSSQSTKTFPSIEVEKNDIIIASYSAHCYDWPPTPFGEEVIGHEEKWYGFKTFTGANSFNKRQLADAAESIIGAHGFVPKIYTTPLADRTSAGQDFYVSISSVYVIRSFSSRFDF